MRNPKGRTVRLTRGVSWIGLALLSCPAAAWAQAETAAAEPEKTTPAQQAEGDGLGEIVVTAQRRSESLQRVPLAVTAFNQAQIEQRGITQALDLSGQVPNLKIGVESFRNSVEISLRGITSRNNTENGDPAVAFHVDGVYVPRPENLVALLYDLNRIEVLRGPQGTLYGRNAVAGTINVISNRPDPGSTSARFDIGFGNYDLFEARGVANLPLVKDRLAVRASFLRISRDGYFDNLGSVRDNYSNADQFGARLGTLWNITDRLNWFLTADYFRDRGAGNLSIRVPLAPGEQVFRRAVDTPGTLNVDYVSLRSRAEWKLSDPVSIAYLAGVGWNRRYQLIDLDGTVLASGRNQFRQDNNLFNMSQELQINYNSNKLKGVLGLFYFYENNNVRGDVDLAPAPGTVIGLSFQNPERTARALAAFAQGTYKLTDTLGLTLGIRYSNDRKTDFNSGVFLCDGGFENSPCNVVRSGAAGARISASYSRATWRTGLDWQITRDHLVYGLVATGYKAGGFEVVTDPPYGPENIINYELGSKNTLFGGRAFLNLAAFWMDYRDLQVSQVTFGATPADLSFRVQNAASARIRGIEAELSARVLAGGRIGGSLSYLDARFRRFNNVVDELFPVVNGAPAVQNLSGNRLVRAPEWRFTFDAQYDFELSNGGTLRPFVQFQWQSTSFLREFNGRIQLTDGRVLPGNSAERLGAYSKTDLGLVYTARGERWKIEAYVHNLENNFILNNVSLVPVVGASGAYDPPRTFGVRASIGF